MTDKPKKGQKKEPAQTRPPRTEFEHTLLDIARERDPSRRWSIVDTKKEQEKQS